MRFSVKIKEARDVFGISSVFVVSEEEETLFYFLDDVLGLSLIVVFGLRIELSGCVLQFVRLSSLLTFRNHFFYTAFSVCAFEVLKVCQEAHYVRKLRLWVADQIFEPDEECWHLSKFSVVHDSVQPVLVVLGAVADPPVPPLWVLFVIVERSFTVMIGQTQKIQPREHNIEWISDNNE